MTGSGTAQITINPSSALSDDTEYYVIVNKNAFQDSRGNDYVGFTSTTTWSFTTGEYTAPTIITLSPADDATNVSITANLVLTFDEAVRGGTGSIFIKKSTDDSVVEEIDANGLLVTGSGTTIMTVDPSSALANSTSYYVTIEANAFEDVSANNFAGISSVTTWNFTTVAAASAPAATSDSSVEEGSGGGGRRSVESVMRASIAPSAPSSVVDNASLSPRGEPITVKGEKGTQVFHDVFTNDWFGVYVKKLINLKIFEGYKTPSGEPLGMYGPGDNFTMGQLAKVASILGKNEVIGETTGEQWALPYVDAAKRAEFTAFIVAIDPAIDATRGAVIQTILEALDIPMNASGSSFEDVPARHLHAAAIATAKKRGIISGDDGTDTFRPNDSINRAEVSKMIIEAWNLSQ